MRSIRAAHDGGRRSPHASQGTARRLSAAEQRWLLDQFTRSRSTAAAAEDAANPREQKPVIDRIDETRATAAAPPRERRASPREEPPPVATASLPAIGEPGPSEMEILSLPASVALPESPASPRVIGLPRPARLQIEGLGYRAVFACTRSTTPDPVDE